MKRAAIIITDADELGYQELHRNAFGEHASAPRRVMPSGQLLADLRTLERHADATVRALVGSHGRDGERWSADLAAAAARVRALLPEEDEDE